MRLRTQIPTIEDDGNAIQLILVERTGPQRRVGPPLRCGALDPKVHEYARALFDGVEPGPDGDLIKSLLRRSEEFALNGIYSGARSTREMAAARTVVLWATLAIRSLAGEQETSGGQPAVGIEHRLTSLVAFAQGEQADPLNLADPTPIVDRGANEGQEIVLQPFQNRWAIFNEIAASIAFTTFASAGSFVFLGVRLQKCTGRCDAGGITGLASSLDIIALVICSFGFLFATLSYANATGVLARLSTLRYGEALERGNRVSEYFGVYALIYAVPLAVEGSTSSPIPLIVKVVALIAFFGYHWAPRFSLLERVISDEGFGGDRTRHGIVLFLLGTLALAWFGPSLEDGDGGLWIRVVASALFLSATCLVYMIASRTPEQATSSSYRVHSEDFLNDESPSRTARAPSPTGDAADNRRVVT